MNKLKQGPQTKLTNTKKTTEAKGGFRSKSTSSKHVCTPISFPMDVGDFDMFKTVEKGPATIHHRGKMMRGINIVMNS